MSKKNKESCWPLATNNFTFLDRIKISLFFLKKSNRWTQDKYVREYEQKIANYVGSQYAVFVSSGSSANQLIAQYVKDKLVSSGEWGKKNKVVLSAVSWQTNASVWIREGFEPIFIDINLKDFAVDEEKLEDVIKNKKDEIAAIFPTSVLGYTPSIAKYRELEYKYGVKFYLDNCENFFGEAIAPSFPGSYRQVKKNINGFITCSTSGYVAHQINSGGESGVIFTNNEDEYKYFLLARAHGLSRNLKPYANKTIFSSLPPWPDLNYYYPWEYEPIYNDLVDQEFNFTILSSNYRNTDIAAYCSLLDMKKWDENKDFRIEIYNYFKQNLDPIKYYLPSERNGSFDVAFCLPLIVNGNDKEIRINMVKNILKAYGIEYRSFISGNMLRQTPYKKYGNYKDYNNAEYINNFAIYIGINNLITLNNLQKLIKKLNNL